MSDSIWRSIDTAEKSDYGKMECMEMTDVAIVGGGLCGILCAWFLMNFSKSGKTVDESRAWLKRIVVCWAVLKTLGAIVT